MPRGVNREPCFFAEEDYHCRFHWRFEAAAGWHWAVRASVLMTNHVHLPVTPQTSDGLAKLMQSVGRRHVPYVSRFYKRRGTLREGCFQSSLVQTEDYPTDVRLVLIQGQALGSERFKEEMSTATGVVRTQWISL